MSVDLPATRALAGDVLRPGHFFSKRPLTWRHVEAETSRWEVFQGRLLDPAHTRRTATFEAWNVHVETPDGPSPEPVLSLKLDAAAGVLHVVRGIDSYVWETYSEGNVLHSREARRWVRELVASFELARFESSADLRDELTCALARAVTGTRLPLTPVEAPLPAFSFGELFYFPEPTDTERMQQHSPNLLSWVGPAVGCGMASRLVEFWLRAEQAGSVDFPNLLIFWVAGGNTIDSLFGTFKRVFDDISLSPWTDLVEKLLGEFRRYEESLDAARVLDFESHLLRLVCRHLTAYDLVTFHHRGANYPDALLLDAVLNDYLARLDEHPDLFAGDEGRIRRRALRQAYLLRRRYENHPVPDAPTSPGEHMRAYPGNHPRVPEEQVLQPQARKRRLYEGDPLRDRLSPAALAALSQSAEDLRHFAERQELSAALYLDRPFGGAKGTVEPDGTPLLTSLAYSRSIAAARLCLLREDLGVPEADPGELELPGVPLDRIGPAVRQGTVSLADAARAAPDFVFRHTLPGSVAALREWVDFGPWAQKMSGRVLVARAPTGPGLWVYDEAYRPFLEVTPRLEAGYLSRRGVEYPAAGVQLRELPQG